MEAFTTNQFLVVYIATCPQQQVTPNAMWPPLEGTPYRPRLRTTCRWELGKGMHGSKCDMASSMSLQFDLSWQLTDVVKMSDMASSSSVHIRIGSR